MKVSHEICGVGKEIIICFNVDRDFKFGECVLFDPTSQPSTQPSSKPTMQPTRRPSQHPTSQPSGVPFKITKPPSNNPKILVDTVFGTGRAASTDSTGLLGEINSPRAAVFDKSENYIYLTDYNGGGLIRKLAVTSNFTTPFKAKYSVKTVFSGKMIFHNLIFF